MLRSFATAAFAVALAGCAEVQVVCPEGTDVGRHIFSGGAEAEWCRRDDGVRQGPEIRYYESGARMIEGEYLDGVRQGEWRYYTSGARMWRRDRWEDGALLGKVIAPPRRGPDGAFIDVFEPTDSDVLKLASADPELERRLRSDELPVFAVWYANGKPRVLGRYDADGLRTGTWQFWYETGGLAREIDYDAGVRERLFREWHPNGQAKTDGDYSVGERDGRWRRWDEAGHVVSDETYGRAIVPP
jgi:uncharacterized protein